MNKNILTSKQFIGVLAMALHHLGLPEAVSADLLHEMYSAAMLLFAGLMLIWGQLAPNRGPVSIPFFRN